MSIHDNVFDLIDEMTEPTGPILGWKAQVHIKQYLNHPDMTIPEIGKAIAAKLRKCQLFMARLQADDICYELENAQDQDEVNEWLAEMYDVCDSERVWCAK